MSDYTPKYIDPESWRIINSIIRKYPRMYVELVEETNNIMFSRVAKETSVIAGHVSDPTSSKAIRLSSIRRGEATRKCEAINFCLSMLRTDHYRVVCLRFWGVENTGLAFTAVKENIPVRGMKYESILTPKTLGEQGRYSIRQSKRIVRQFVLSVGKELGEI